MQTTSSKTPEEILRQLRQVAMMVMQAAEADTLEQLLQRIAHTARELIGARYAALGVPDYKGGLAFFKVSGITEEQIRQIPHQPVGLGLLGMIMRRKEALRIPSIKAHEHAVGFPEGHPEMEALLGVPVQLGEQLFGIFYLTEPIGKPEFTEDDQWLLEIMAGYAALVIAEKHLHDQRRQISLMREREQIGMTLHDGVIQSIYALGMRLDLARRKGHIPPEEINNTLLGLNQVIEDIRHAIFHLREDTQDAISLRQRLQRVIAQLYIPSNVSVSIEDNHHSLLLSPETADTIELMTNECISNAVRHASAKNITITIKDRATDVEVVIQDNGVGFDVEALKKHNGLGLKNLERRARMHGGSVYVESQPQKGTKVHIVLPTA